ncbi:MAG: aminotransferase class III-fold pyridoxal phosphate-dependent enzyme [Rhodospirillales bacterium]|nr:aminotransferase class III-fold pyridoxal phosphate-dependent enzyme [Rhodospirillales bacterium]
MTARALLAAADEATELFDREHVTAFIRANRHRFAAGNVTCPVPGLQDHRWTLDTPADYDHISALAEGLTGDGPPSYLDVLEASDRLAASDHGPVDAGRSKSPWQRTFEDRHATYDASQALFERAKAVIPLASQTFSKSHIQYPQGQAPLFLSHGRGGRVWDVDGNEFVDMVGGLLPVVLGYNDPDVDEAIRHQLDRGITFSLASELEVDLAERLVDIIPCAEMTRFGKNGSDATSAAVRIARAHTGRDHIAVCGYHGWQDWYIGSTTRNKGVPKAVRELTHPFPFNDLDVLNKLFSEHQGGIAAVIMEPMNVTEPADGYFESVRELAHDNGALFIFDEIITGFRYGLGGAQELFGVTPDLAAFGKAMGNGMPISAVVGRADLMAEMEEIFFSSTFGGEALSLAAAIATIDKMKREPVIETLWRSGKTLIDGIEKRIAEHGLGDCLSMCGKPPWSLLAMTDHAHASKDAIKTLFIGEMLNAGILIQASHNMSYAHEDHDLAAVLAGYDRALGRIAEEIKRGNVDGRLGNAIIRPIFTVR